MGNAWLTPHWPKIHYCHCVCDITAVYVLKEIKSFLFLDLFFRPQAFCNDVLKLTLFSDIYSDFTQVEAIGQWHGP